MAKVEFFYDYSSPWTYLAFTKIEGICQKYGATLEWRPILVGGIFNTVNPSVYEFRERGVPANRLSGKLGQIPPWCSGSARTPREVHTLRLSRI